MKTRKIIYIAAGLIVVAAFAALWWTFGRGKTFPGAPGAADPLALVPPQCEAVVVAPDLGRLGERLQILPRLKLAQLGASLANVSSSEALIGELSRQAGVDLRSRESMTAAGLDPSRPLAIWVPPGAMPVVLAPAADFGKLETLLATHAKNRLGAGVRSDLAIAGKTATAFARTAGGSPELILVRAGNYLAAAAGFGAAASLERVLWQKPEGSLAADARFARARERLERSELYAFVCPGSRVSASAKLADGAGLALSISDKELKLALEAPLAKEQLQKLGSLESAKGADLLGRLDPAAFAVLRFSGDPALLKEQAAALTPRMFEAALKRADIDVSEEILGNLQPGLAASFTLAPTANLAMVPELDPRRTNPFKYLFLRALGRARDAAKAEATLKKVVEVAPRFGAQLTERDAAGTKVYTAMYPLGEGASIALKGEAAVVTGGTGQMDAALAALGGPETQLELSDPTARELLQKSPAAVYVDLSKLIASVRSLPDSAYGIGGFAIKAAISRWLDALEELTSLRLTAAVADEALRAELTLTLKLAEKTAEKAQ